MSANIKLATLSGGSVTLNAVDTASNFVMSVPAAPGILINADSSTGAAQLPVGTTAQRPASPVVGQFRYNSTTASPEVYNGASWVAVGGYEVAVLIVAGGGGGSSGNGSQTGGGGGAGGYLTGSAKFLSGASYTVIVGGGGPADTSGALSAVGSVIAYGGGRGIPYNDPGSSGLAFGGSGGGAGQQGDRIGRAIPGQGNNGGAGSLYLSGGGGGAGAVGAYNGGNGLSSSITGTAVVRAGGGGGADTGGGVATGGTGGGGAGGGGNGTVNTGGGGGGSRVGSGGSGGSGIVVISYLGSQRGTGGTVTSSGGYTIHTFTASDAFIA